LILFFKLLENANIQIFSIGYPSTPFPSILSLSKFGQHYSVADDDNVLDPLKISGQLSRIFLDIISQVENQPHHQVFVKVSFSLLFVVTIFDWEIWASLWTDWKQYFYYMFLFLFFICSSQKTTLNSDSLNFCNSVFYAFKPQLSSYDWLL
jgi:hypothetical protein